MRIILIITYILIVYSLPVNAQRGSERTLDNSGTQIGRTPTPSGVPGTQETSSEAPVKPIPHEVKNWFLLDLGTRADTVPIDTLSLGFQLHSPAHREAMANVQLGNLGAPWQPAMVSEMTLARRFIFSENLHPFFKRPHEWRYYNTRTPYTNLYYQYGGPKRRSEEAVGVLFTQNINKDWNAGFDYQLISSIGRYDAQQVENRHFRFFSSYSGEKYEVHGSYVYNKTDHLENGGIIDEDYILNPDEYDYGQTENVPVHFYSASNRIDNHQLYISQALKIGNISVSQRDDESVKLPLGTAVHTLHVDRNRRVHRIDNLNRYLAENPDGFFYPNIYADSTGTRDSVYYTSIKNTFQLKFNEEANALLRFGLRAFITNEIEQYRFPVVPSKYGTFSEAPIYQQGDSVFSTTLIGGQIFKNLGEQFRWNAGMRFYFQGYRSGDSELTGALSSQFRVVADTAQLFAEGGLYLTTPTYFEDRYYSNHFAWENSFDKVQTMRLRGGVKIPTRRLEASVEGRFINDYVFWNQEALPEQTSAFLSVLELQLSKHFSLGGFNSRNTLLYQVSSHQA
ncbi:MAG: putative porin, partial [Bacteroidales bacterium]|nr:putative porin [Bacteroidales bacterium]